MGNNSPPQTLREKQARAIEQERIRTRGITKTVQTQQQTQPVIVDERKQVLDYYLSSGYSARVAEYYKDLYFAEKELEQMKKDKVNYQKIYEKQKSINGLKQDISRATRARDPGSPKIGITKISKKTASGPESFEGGYSTGYQASFPMGGKIVSISNEFSPASDKSFIASSIKGPDIFITTKGEVTQAPYTPSTGGAVFTKQITLKEKTPETLKQQPNLFDLANRDISKGYNAFVPESGRKEFERQRKAGVKLNNLLNQRVGEIGQGVGSVAYEYSYASSRLRNPFLESEFYKTEGPKNLQSTPFIDKPKSEKQRAEYQVVFQDIALKSQYLVPGYGELKFGLDVAETKDVGGLATGAIAFGALKMVGKGVNTLGNLPKQKEFNFVTESAEKDLDKIFGSKKQTVTKESFKIENLQKPFSQVIVGGVITAPIAYSVFSKKSFIQSEYNIDNQKKLAYEESVKEARQFGAGKTGFQLAEYATPRITPQLYVLGARLTGKKEIPYALLESPQLTAGATNYPKATLNPIKFKKFVEATPKTELGKYFEDYPQAFNVSKGRLPKEYFAGEGTSEFAGQYFAPRYPSFTFGIPKGSLVKSVKDYSILPSFESSGPATVNLAYGKGVRIVEVGKDFGALNELEPGFFYIPTRKGLRTKSESEVIQNIGTKFVQTKEKYFTLYKGKLAQERGFSGGVFFPIPEYYVEGLAGAKTSSFSGPKTLSRLSQEQERNLSYSKNYTRRTPIGAFYSNQTKKTFSSISSRSIKYSYGVPSYRSVSVSRGSGSYSMRSISSGSSRGFSYRKISSDYKPISYYSKSSSIASNVSYSPSSYYRSSSIRKGSGTSYPPYRPPSPPSTPKSKSFSKPNFSSLKNLFSPSFGVVTKFRGKERLVKSQLTLSDAQAYGARLVNQSLRASFRLVPTGGLARSKGISYENIPLYRSKRDPRFLVEPRSRRLSTRGEITEIQASKRLRRLL